MLFAASASLVWITIRGIAAATSLRRYTMIWAIITASALVGALGFTVYMLDRESRR